MEAGQPVNDKLESLLVEHLPRGDVHDLLERLAAEGPVCSTHMLAVVDSAVGFVDVAIAEEVMITMLVPVAVMLVVTVV